jgi:hypothetical protein
MMTTPAMEVVTRYRLQDSTHDATMHENELDTDTTEAEIANQTLTHAAEQLHDEDGDYYGITTEDELIDYLGLTGIPRNDSHDDVTLITSARNDTISVKHYLYRTPNHGWVHVRTTTNNAGEHRVRHHIKHIGTVTFDGRGIDTDTLLNRCEHSSLAKPHTSVAWR